MKIRIFLAFLLAFFPLFGEEVHRGNYTAASESVRITGVVTGNVYVIGSKITVEGQINGNLIAFGAMIDIPGEVRGNARLIGGQVEIGGTIGGNVKAYTGQLNLDSQATIKGNLTYSSPEQAQIDPGATIDGKVTYNPFQGVFKGKWKKTFFLGARLTGLLMNFLFSFVIGWIFLKVFPQRTKKAVEILRKTPWKAFWIGLITVILIPIACLVLFITILGFPLGLALLAFSLLGFYTAKIFPILWAANACFPKLRLKKHMLLILALGLIVFFILTQIPFVGGILSLAFTFFGLGAILLARLPAKAK
ncbi:MAG: hypothetical protein K1000chlam2_01545 [Chlamydiae bacterium]|nr:hypothetical protein [Chlamydiota bacterium]